MPQTFWEITIDHKGRGVDLAWREESQQDWSDLGEKAGKRFRVAVSSPGRFLLRARPVDKLGAVVASQQRIITLDAAVPVTDRPDPSALSVPDPEVAQEGAAFLVTQRGPLGQRPEEYRWECRHSLEADDPEDAKQVGIFEIGETAREDAWSGVGAQKIHRRLIRKADGVAGPWSSVTLTPKDATEADTEDHTTFGSGAIQPIGDGDVPPLEVDGGELRTRADVALDDFNLTSLDDLAAVTLDMIAGTPSEGTYRTPTIVLPDTQAFAIEFQPVPATLTRPSLSLDDLALDPLAIPEVHEDTDEPIDNEVDRMSATLDGTEEPVRAELKVATSTSDSPTFTAADFKPHVPGRVHVCRSYACEVKLRSLRKTVIEYSSMRIRREIVCRRCDARLVQVRREETAHTWVRGDVVYFNGSGVATAARADAAGTLAAGIVSLVPDVNSYFVALSGVMRWPSHGLTPGTNYYLDAVTAGDLTSTRPTGGNYAQRVLVPLTSDEVLVQLGQGELT